MSFRARPTSSPAPVPVPSIECVDSPRPITLRPTLAGWQPRAWHLAAALMLPFAWIHAQPAPPPLLPPSGPALLQELHGFREMGRVLYVAAHPDDENTQLITYLARGRNYRTAYLSLTRGDGGQNLYGPELGSTLGLARTQELLAARRVDGGLQFFTRALDFGFSKDVRETLTNWDRQAVVGDIVRVIRTFRPDVMITRFSPQPGGTHGHHTASAVLAMEAFKLAGDPKAYPEQLGSLTPWSPKRILQNGSFGGGRGSGGTPPAGALQLDSGGTDPVLGKTFSEIASDSRRMHKTQGFGNMPVRTGQQLETFLLLDGAPATADIFEGVDTSWARLPGGAPIGQLTQEIVTNFKPSDPAASVPALLKVRSQLAALPAGPIVDDKRAQLDHILQGCLGLTVETTLPGNEVVPGETINLQHTVTVRAAMPVKWIAVRYPANGKASKESVDLKANEAMTRTSQQELPSKTVTSQPYWLRNESSSAMFEVADPAMIGRPENPPAFPVEFVLELGGQTLVVNDEPVQVVSGATPETTRRRLEVIAPVSLKFLSATRLLAPGTSQPVEIEVTSVRAETKGTLTLDVPGGWKLSPAKQPFSFSKAGEKARFAFSLTSPSKSTTAKVDASAEVNGQRYGQERNVIDYGHIPVLLLQPQARLKAVSLEVAVRGHKIGYLPGAGDNVAEGIAQMGYAVTTLTGADLVASRLKEFDAVVVGVRAFNTRKDLVANLPGLFAYAEAGGTVIEQYNRPGGDLKTDQFAPYLIKISNERVTDERAPVTFLAPRHPVLNTPNKITAADFEGWTQERGSYFPTQWGEQFVPILACNDVGESPMSGSLLIAPHGKGYIVYTGLSFFRQLPDGVPGAYRLFANLLSLGK